MLKELKIYKSLATTQSVGWERDDSPMVHVFAQAEPGQPFTPSNGRGGPHWPCKVCTYHGYTKADFHNQMSRLMKPIGSDSAQPITHDGVDRAFKTCKCSKCGNVSECTPENDFYCKKRGGPLRCEKCMLGGK